MNTNEILVQRIVDVLKSNPRRDIYEAGKGRRGEIPSGEYWITYQGGGPIPKDIVLSMVKAGMLKRKYENCECYQLA